MSCRIHLKNFGIPFFYGAIETAEQELRYEFEVTSSEAITNEIELAYTDGKKKASVAQKEDGDKYVFICKGNVELLLQQKIANFIFNGKWYVLTYDNSAWLLTTALDRTLDY